MSGNAGSSRPASSRREYACRSNASAFCTGPLPVFPEVLVKPEPPDIRIESFQSNGRLPDFESGPLRPTGAKGAGQKSLQGDQGFGLSCEGLLKLLLACVSRRDSIRFGRHGRVPLSCSVSNCRLFKTARTYFSYRDMPSGDFARRKAGGFPNTNIHRLGNSVQNHRNGDFGWQARCHACISPA